mmetsp:Transcript_67402/g.217642  ORF Transcript_67402/g.217642 Transcript_67402/m.217642 type:complete len:245 (+) Transcript_67402:590-1324(+)
MPPTVPLRLEPRRHHAHARKDGGEVRVSPPLPTWSRLLQAPWDQARALANTVVMARSANAARVLVACMDPNLQQQALALGCRVEQPTRRHQSDVASGSRTPQETRVLVVHVLQGPPPGLERLCCRPAHHAASAGGAAAAGAGRLKTEPGQQLHAEPQVPRRRTSGAPLHCHCPAAPCWRTPGAVPSHASAPWPPELRLPKQRHRGRFATPRALPSRLQRPRLLDGDPAGSHQSAPTTRRPLCKA